MPPALLAPRHSPAVSLRAGTPAAGRFPRPFTGLRASAHIRRVRWIKTAGEPGGQRIRPLGELVLVGKLVDASSPVAATVRYRSRRTGFQAQVRQGGVAMIPVLSPAKPEADWRRRQPATVPRLHPGGDPPSPGYRSGRADGSTRSASRFTSARSASVGVKTSSVNPIAAKSPTAPRIWSGVRTAARATISA